MFTNKSNTAPVATGLRRCPCGGLMGRVAVRQWRKRAGGTALGYEEFYSCRRCGLTVSIPSAGRLAQLGVTAVLAFLFTTAFVVGLIVIATSKEQPKNPPPPTGFITIGGIVMFAGFIVTAWLLVKGLQNRRRYPAAAVQK